MLVSRRSAAAQIGEKWTAHPGCEIIDGIGSTEMLHIFLSNRPGDVRYGTTGKAVPGYVVELRDETGHVLTGSEEVGISPTSAVHRRR